MVDCFNRSSRITSSPNPHGRGSLLSITQYSQGKKERSNQRKGFAELSSSVIPLQTHTRTCTHIPLESWIGCWGTSLLKSIYLFTFREKEREREREGEKHRCAWETDWLPLAHTRPRTKPATQEYALTGYRTSNLSLCRMMPNQLSHAGQGKVHTIFF